MIGVTDVNSLIFLDERSRHDNNHIGNTINFTHTPHKYVHTYCQVTQHTLHTLPRYVKNGSPLETLVTSLFQPGSVILTVLLDYMDIHQHHVY